MDTSVALVQAYLHINGYFTVVEYPVLEAVRDQARAVTDLDILALRFAHAGHEMISGQQHRPIDGKAAQVDPRLGCPLDRPDMIVAEVKEGAARLNDAMRDPLVLQIALTRFGCCSSEHAAMVTAKLLKSGHAIAPGGHSVRILAFGDAADGIRHGPWTTIPMRHVVSYLQAYLREHWAVLRHAQIRDPSLALLALLEKWGANNEHRVPHKERRDDRMRMPRRS